MIAGFGVEVQEEEGEDGKKEVPVGNIEYPVITKGPPRVIPGVLERLVRCWSHFMEIYNQKLTDL